MPGFLFACAKSVVAIGKAAAAWRDEDAHGTRSTNAAAAVTRCAVIRERITHRRAPSSSGRRRVRAPKKEKGARRRLQYAAACQTS
ncbi:hypothetical protein [Burkholderia multivorans]|uniref:hypothetical protein n=1 Tax=Burkholderia multivorans TaxID=87883 RepID=UPI0011773B1C|nr:hypothetical protein [Burkholderia multivorans]